MYNEEDSSTASLQPLAEHSFVGSIPTTSST